MHFFQKQGHIMKISLIEYLGVCFKKLLAIVSYISNRPWRLMNAPITLAFTTLTATAKSLGTLLRALTIESMPYKYHIENIKPQLFCAHVGGPIREFLCATKIASTLAQKPRITYESHSRITLIGEIIDHRSGETESP